MIMSTTYGFGRLVAEHLRNNYLTLLTVTGALSPPILYLIILQ